MNSFLQNMFFFLFPIVIPFRNIESIFIHWYFRLAASFLALLIYFYFPQSPNSFRREAVSQIISPRNTWFQLEL